MFDEAIGTLRRLVELAPHDISAPIRKVIALASLRRFEDARQAFIDAREQDPTAFAQHVQRVAAGVEPDIALSPENIYFWQCHRAQGRCEWKEWEACAHEMRHLPDTARLEPAAAFIAFHQAIDGQERLRIAKAVAAPIERDFPSLREPSKSFHSKIRLGILSPDLREHLNGYLLLPLVQLADRDLFEVFAYSLARDDGSAIRKDIAASTDQFRDLSDTSNADAADLIRSDGVDILIDAGGHTVGSRFAIVARRPARIQVNYLGFPGSLGSSRVDYAIVDRVVGIDPSEWIESLVCLPHTYFLYDFRASVPEHPISRSAYGLPDNAFVFCAFHKAEKISPDLFELWVRVLGQVPSSVLWFLAQPDAARRNLEREAKARGIDAARLVFAPFDPRDRYLARQRLGDLMLDAIHHSAMTTACDAMAAGLPVLTIPGNAMASRAGESLARAAGVPEMVARDKDDYVEKAVFLAQNSEELQRIRQKLLARTGPLFDTVGRVRELEQAFLEMWRRHEQRH